MRPLYLVMTMVLAALIVAGCDFGTSDPGAEATIAALSTENARLATAAATLTPPGNPPAGEDLPSPATVPATGAPTSTAAATVADAAPASLAAATPTAASGSLPMLLAEVALAGPDDYLLDLRHDRAANRLYVTDSTGQLHVLDAATYERLTTLPAAGEITLDPARQRLFVAPADRIYQPEPFISVVDTQQLTVTQTISGMTHLALDRDHNRLFVGRRLTSPYGQGGPPVRVVDGATFETIGELAQAGIPVYNPFRNEVLIVAYTVNVADPEQGEIVQDLLPEISSQECPDCVGGWRAEDVYLFPEQNLLALNVQIIGTAGGSGYRQPPRFFDATTLTEMADAAQQPVIQEQCGSQRTLQPLIDNRLYRPAVYARYVVFNNLLVYDSAGTLLTWRDGLGPLFVNDNTGHGYTGGWLLDLDVLQPVGLLPAGFCLFEHDGVGGRLFGSRRHVLTVLAESGGEATGLPSETTATLAGQPIQQIVVSPGYAADQTVFVVTSAGAIYRSTDGGVEWVALRNGLHWEAPATIRLAISPNFAADRTLFAGGYRQQTQGLGVFRSTDGGESWQPAWRDLTHLRVQDLIVSPAYANDETVLAYAHYQRIQPWEAGTSIHRSTDGGVSWSLALTSTAEISPALRRELIPGIDAALLAPVRSADNGRGIERSTDGGITWDSVELDQPSGATILAIEPALGDPQGAFYVLGTQNLWRLRNNGAVVERWNDERLANRTFTNTLAALAVSPPLAEGSHQLFVGTNAGEFWRLDPAALNWEPVAATALAPTEMVTPTTGPSPTPQPLSSPPAPLDGEPPAGFFRPVGTFAGVWESNEELQRWLGWASSEQATPVDAAYQTFEQGVMIWRGDEERIYVLFSDGVWLAFDDTFREGEPEFDSTLRPPEGRQQPVRGFGKVWRTHPDVRTKLGWATAREDGVTAQVQSFSNGTMLWVQGIIYTLLEEPNGQLRWVVA
jgi:hypothetical protein